MECRCVVKSVYLRSFGIDINLLNDVVGAGDGVRAAIHICFYPHSRVRGARKYLRMETHGWTRYRFMRPHMFLGDIYRRPDNTNGDLDQPVNSLFLRCGRRERDGENLSRESL